MKMYLSIQSNFLASEPLAKLAKNSSLVHVKKIYFACFCYPDSKLFSLVIENRPQMLSIELNVC